MFKSFSGIALAFSVSLAVLLLLSPFVLIVPCTSYIAFVNGDRTGQPPPPESYT